MRYVVFGLETFGVIDPCHDGEVIEASRNLFATLPSWDKPSVLTSKCQQSSLATRSQARMRVDSTLIAQAIGQFSNLKLIMVGNELVLPGLHVKHSWGSKSIVRFRCPSGRCDFHRYRHSLLRTFPKVIRALQQVPRLHAEIGIGMGIGDQSEIMSEFSERGVTKIDWYPYPNLQTSLTHLEWNVDLMVPQTSETLYTGLFQGSKVKTLVLSYEHEYAQRDISSMRLPATSLSQLKDITLRKMRADPNVLTAFLAAHKDSLESVSLIDCSIWRQYEYKSPNTSRDYSWAIVLLLLEKMPNLQRLQLDRLGCKNNESVKRYSIDARLDMSMSLQATWHGKGQIHTGLKYLNSTCRIISFVYKITRPAIVYPPSAFPYAMHAFLNLRYANFKASPAFAWTKSEIDHLHWHRQTLRDQSGDPALEHTVADDPLEFPIPADVGPSVYSLPPGHVCLSPADPLLRGVWVRD